MSHANFAYGRWDTPSSDACAAAAPGSPPYLGARIAPVVRGKALQTLNWSAFLFASAPACARPGGARRVSRHGHQVRCDPLDGLARAPVQQVGVGVDGVPPTGPRRPSCRSGRRSAPSWRVTSGSSCASAGSRPAGLEREWRGLGVVTLTSRKTCHACPREVASAR